MKYKRENIDEMWDEGIDEKLESDYENDEGYQMLKSEYEQLKKDVGVIDFKKKNYTVETNNGEGEVEDMH